MLQDLRAAIRLLARHRGYACAAALVLALGLAANTALYAIVNAVLFRTLPVRDPDQLVYLYTTLGDRPFVVGYPDYEHLAKHGGFFSQLAAHWAISSRLSVGSQTDSFAGEYVSGNYFEALGVSALLGRILLPEDDDPANPESAVVISHDLWTRRFDADPRILGREMKLNDKIFTVVGVMGPTFKGVSDPWTPSQFWASFAQTWGEKTRQFGVAPIGRLKPGITREQAQGLVVTLGKGIPNRERFGWLVLSANQVRLPFDPYGSVVPSRLAIALMAVVVAVLLIAVANVAGLMSARGVARRSEIAIRRSLGAKGARIAGQVLTEAVLLSALGGGLGLFLACWLLRVFVAITPGRFALDVPLDGRVLFFAAVSCVGTGILVGLAPAFQGLRIDVGTALGSRFAERIRRQSHLRHWSVVPQIMLSVALLVVASIYVRRLVFTEAFYPGYSTAGVFVTRVLPQKDTSEIGKGADDVTRRNQRAERSRAYFRQLVEQLASNPGIVAAGVSTRLPLHYDLSSPETVIGQEALGDAGAGVATRRFAVSPGYFAALKISIIRGRSFDERDAYASPRVAIVSKTLANRLWAGREPVGKLLAFGPTTNRDQGPEWLEVVGVVNDVSPVLHDERQDPSVYVPLAQQWHVGFAYLVVRSVSGTILPVHQLLMVAKSAGSYAELSPARSMRDMVAELLYPRRMAAGILSAAAFVGLLLSGIGIYGAVSYSVARRLKELGIRAALGAQWSDLTRLVVGEGFLLAAIGTLLGALLAFPLLRIVSTAVVAVPPVDTVTILLVPLLVGTVVVLACWVPARRAMRVDPVVVLREL